MPNQQSVRNRLIVLHLGAPDSKSTIYLKNAFNEHPSAALIKPTPLWVSYASSLCWWANPLEGENLWEVVKSHPDLSLNKAQDWINTDEYVQKARNLFLADLAERNDLTSGSLLDSVKLVLLDGRSMKGTPQQRHVLDGLFPNAVQKYCTVQTSGNLVFSDQAFESIELDRMIEELDLGTKAYTSLKREGVAIVGDLTSKTERDLLKIPNFGSKTIKDVIDTLRRYGLSLKE